MQHEVNEDLLQNEVVKEEINAIDNRFEQVLATRRQDFKVSEPFKLNPHKSECPSLFYPSFEQLEGLGAQQASKISLS